MSTVSESGREPAPAGVAYACPRLGRSILIPRGWEVVSLGLVAAGDKVWWEASPSGPAAFHKAEDDLGDGTTSVGDNVSSIFCCIRKTPSKKKAKTEAVVRICPKCGCEHPVPGVWNNVEVVENGVAKIQVWCGDCSSRHAAVCGCVDCTAVVAVEGATPVDGEPWCRGCVEDYAKPCGHCGKYHSEEALAEVVIAHPGAAGAARGIEHWCQVCVEALAATCSHCDTLMSSALLEEGHTVDGDRWCRPCAEAGARACYDCGEWSEHGHMDADSEEWFCNVCMPPPAPRVVPPPPRSSRVNYVHGYHQFPGPLNFYGAEKYSGALFLGFELESGGAQDQECRDAATAVAALSDGEKRFHLERDGSIPDYGFELISAPMTLTEHQTFDWKKVTTTLIKSGLRSHDLGGRCGLHVHVSRAFLTGSECAKLDIFIQKNQKFWEHVARRPESSYAKFQVKSGISGYGKSETRYSSLNFLHKGTVEFRLFRGTLRYDTLMATLELVDAVCRWIKTRNSISICRNHAECNGFVKWMRQDKARYGRALDYILRTKAYIESEDKEV